MSTRADKLTPLSNVQELFSDIPINLDISPVTGNLSRLLNEEAIKQSIRNLILTAPGERLFDSNIGSGIYKLLFEPFDELTSFALQTEITNTIKNYEPRANLLNVKLNPSDADQTYYVNILFSIINSQRTAQLDISLSKVR